MSDAQAATASPGGGQPPRDPRKRWSRAVAWMLNACLAAVMVAVLALGALALYLKNETLTAPEWVKTRIEDRLAKGLPEARVQFGSVAVLMGDSWTPRLQLRDVSVRQAQGGELVHANEVEASFAAGPLWDGQLQPRRIALSGIVAELKRSADGSVSLKAGGALSSERQAATMGALIAQIDEILLSPSFEALTEIDVRALTLRYEDAVSERAWTADGGRLRLSRDGTDLTLGADLALLSGGAGVATVAASYTSQIGEIAAGFGVQFEDVAAEDIAAQGPAFAWLGVLQAGISGSVRSGLDATGRLEPLAATLQIGAGVVQPDASALPVPFEGLRSYFSYDPDARVLTFDELSVDSKWISGVAVGTASLGVDPDTGQLQDLVAQIALSDLRANPNGLYETPIQIAGAEADFRLALDPFRLTIGRAQISEGDQMLSLDGAVTVGQDGWHVALNGGLDVLTPQRLLELWPENAVVRIRDWIRDNILAADISNLDVAFRSVPGSAPNTYVAFDYADADVRYSKTLPPVMGGSGHFSIDDGRMVVSVDGGTITPPQGGAISVAGSSFIIPDIGATEGTPSVVRVAARSSIEATLSLLNIPPLAAMDKARLPVALADGRSDVTATLALSLKRGTRPKVQFHADGVFEDVRSDVLVPNRTLQAANLRVFADNAGLRIAGRGSLDGVAFDGSFQQPIGAGAGPGVVRASLPLTDGGLRTFGVNLPQGSVSGQGTAQFEAVLARGAPPEFEITSDLAGVGVSIPPLNWRKPAQQEGRVRVAGQFGTEMAVDVLELSAPGLRAEGSIAFADGAALERVRLDRLDVGNWLNAPVDLVSRGAGRPMRVVLRGGALDLRQADFGGGDGTGDGVPLEVALDRLQISDTIALTDMRGSFGTRGGLDGTFEALLNGTAPVAGTIIPQNGRSAVRLRSDDAGAVLRAAGLLRQVQGGALQLLLLPVGSGGAFDGRLSITGPRVRDAPGIAALLNAVSVVGLINELNGDGIYFEDVEASFRLTPNQLTLTEASAVGASMGLSMDGTYLLDSRQLDMQGVVSPVYLLNGIGSILTRRGEGLIGFNYALNGSAQAPQVSVNPLSALTPAMFREIFRAPPPELPAVDGVTESTLPAPEPQVQRPIERPEGR